MKTTYIGKVKTSPSKIKAPPKVNISSSIANAKHQVTNPPLWNENLKKVKLFNSKFDLNFYFVPIYHSCGRL